MKTSSCQHRSQQFVDFNGLLRAGDRLDKVILIEVSLYQFGNFISLGSTLSVWTPVRYLLQLVAEHNWRKLANFWLRNNVFHTHTP